MTRHRVASKTEIEPGSMQTVKAGADLICLVNLVECGFRAIDGMCTHEEELLADGMIWGNEIECPAHGSRFDLDTGAVSGLPATRPVRTHRVTVNGDDVYVEV